MEEGQLWGCCMMGMWCIACKIRSCSHRSGLRVLARMISFKRPAVLLHQGIHEVWAALPHELHQGLHDCRYTPLSSR
jgi:hypothetical protein